jgi:hypothetical protein
MSGLEANRRRRSLTELPTFFIIDADEQVLLAFEGAEWDGNVPPLEFIQRVYLETKLEELSPFGLTAPVQSEMEVRVTQVLQSMMQTGALFAYGFLGRAANRTPFPVFSDWAALLN